MGTLAYFVNSEALEIDRDLRVVVQSGRGLELAVVKALATDGMAQQALAESVGPIVRLASDADDLAHQRIDRLRSEGVTACSQWLIEHGFPEILLDAEVTLDGQRVYFHFLGEVSYELEKATETLVEVFDQATGVRQFTQAVITGCGPTCGSDGSGCSSKSGDASGGCVSCAIKSACKPSGNRR